MTVVLAILKFIGILLLVLLALVLVLLLIVLFFPVSYRIWGSYYDKPVIRVKCYWLFHLFSLHWQYENENVQQYLRIFGIKKDLQKDSAKEAGQPAKVRMKPEKKQKKTTENLEEPIKEVSEDTKEIKSDIVEIPEITKDSLKSGKRKSIFQRVQSIIQQIREKLHDIKQRLLRIKKNFTKIKDILQDGECRLAFFHLKDELILFLKRLNPRKIKLNACFSTGSPDTTGGALGVFALFPAVYKNRWNIYPDFESEKFYIRADFDIYGRIFIFQMLGIVLRIVFDKNCRKLYNKMTE